MGLSNCPSLLPSKKGFFSTAIGNPKSGGVGGTFSLGTWGYILRGARGVVVVVGVARGVRATGTREWY